MKGEEVRIHASTHNLSTHLPSRVSPCPQKLREFCFYCNEEHLPRHVHVVLDYLVNIMPANPSEVQDQG